jgi:hypothetical protein
VRSLIRLASRRLCSAEPLAISKTSSVLTIRANFARANQRLRQIAFHNKSVSAGAIASRAPIPKPDCASTSAASISVFT